MRVLVLSVQVPFVRSGAEAQAEGLVAALRRLGHQAELVTMPFRFSPPQAVMRCMEIWESEDLMNLDGYRPDCIICLKFPAYYAQHRHKIVWLIHQHRQVYELWTEAAAREPDACAMREQIFQKDWIYLSGASKLRTESRTVSARLKRFNNIEAQPLYHPPPRAESYYTLPPQPYVFYPSRLEDLKRQELLIRAMQYTRSRVFALIAGEGGARARLEALIEELGLSDRVRLLGRIPDEDLPSYYACSLGVFFGPRDEDYGYVTLEAMLSAKPVITCTDSGGPLEFVRDGETGYVVEPEPERVAEAIERLAERPARSVELGRAGRLAYESLGISWERVVCELL